jgi:hypothetical protein
MLKVPLVLQDTPHGSASGVARATPEEVAALVSEGHDACAGGTWCDCQHKIPGAVMIDAPA